MYLKLRVKVLPCLHVVSIDISFRIIAYFGAGIRFSVVCPWLEAL